MLSFVVRTTIDGDGRYKFWRGGGLNNPSFLTQTLPLSYSTLFWTRNGSGSPAATNVVVLVLVGVLVGVFVVIRFSNT